MINNNTRPLFRWAGSKSKLLPKLKPYWSDNFKRYLEPFAGSAALYFSLQPKKALLNDVNSQLIETYEQVRDHPRAVFNRYSKLELGKDSYYKIREINSETLDPLTSAARFIFLNRFCFNGIYRTNMKGQFNVPFSSSGTGNLQDWETLKNISKQLKQAKLSNKDYLQFLRSNAREGDFVYLDPPYAVNNRRIFKQYGPDTFGLNDLENLASYLDKLEIIGVKFLVSYAVCKEALELFDKWNTKKVYTQRNVSGFAKHRRKAVELLVSNIEISQY